MQYADYSQNMTRAMASHHAPDGIRVNCVCPGMVYTPMLYASGMSEEARESRKNRSLLKTEGTGWDVGAAIRFLAGDEARWCVSHGLAHGNDTDRFKDDWSRSTRGRRFNGCNRF